MRTSEKGKAIIKRHEGLRLEAYPDPATGGDPWTIGYGHTSKAGEPLVKKGMVITEHQADTILGLDLQAFEAHVPEGTQNQFDAMVSLCFNIGAGNFNKSSVKKYHEARNFSKAANAFMSWTKANGKVFKGLVTRREAEKKLYLGTSH